MASYGDCEKNAFNLLGETRNDTYFKQRIFNKMISLPCFGSWWGGLPWGSRVLPWGWRFAVQGFVFFTRNQLVQVLFLHWFCFWRFCRWRWLSFVRSGVERIGLRGYWFCRYAWSHCISHRFRVKALLAILSYDSSPLFGDDSSQLDYRRNHCSWNLFGLGCCKAKSLEHCGQNGFRWTFIQSVIKR